MIGILLAAGLSQAVLPKAATDTIEVVVSADGVAKIPPQAYRVMAFIGLQEPQGDPARSVDLPALRSQLAQLEMPARDTCTPSSPFGFVGNEAWRDEDAEASEPADGAATGWTVYAPGGSPPERYSGLFKTKAAADEAAKLLRTQAHSQPSTTPVLFDCSDAVKQAQLDALAGAQRQIEPIAEALGRRVLGVTRIDFSQGQATVAFTLAMSALTFGGSRDEIDMPASVNVHFLLGK